MAERRTYGQWSLNAGELGPRLFARVDQAIYQNALAEMVGWLPLLQGPAIAAPGTRYVAAAAGPCRLFPFEFVPTQGYVVEGSNLKFRFYTNDARIETAPGVAYEVAHTYSYADLLVLDYWQSEDVIYLAGAGKKPKKLSRTSAITFAIADLDLKNGPLEIGNSDETITVNISGSLTVGGGVTIAASDPIFAPGDVGGLFEVECEDFGEIKSWEPAVKGMTVNKKLKWAGNVYQIEALSDPDGYTGSSPPEHNSGSEWDGSSGRDGSGNGPFGVKLKYLYGRFGLVRITGYTNTTHVTASVIKRIPDSLATVDTWRWAFGAFSDTRGWPDTVGGWNDCLVFTKGNRGYTSVIGDYENFERRDHHGDFERDLAGQFTLPQPAAINWQASDRYLLLGTDTAEYSIERLQVQTGTPGPPVFDIRLQSSNGSRKVKPIQADGRMLFLQRAGRKLREMGYALSSDRYVAPDMTRLADHIGAPGIVELAWQAEPERLAWAVRGDGSLAAMTYDPEQQVMGWSRRYFGGTIAGKSACRITDPEGKRDQIWIAADKGDGTYWVLRQEKIWETGDDQTDAFFVDAGLSYIGAPATVMSGLGHLEGQTVDILADGKPHPQKTVVGGSVTLDYAASKVHIGLPFPAYIVTLPPENGQSEGVARGKLQRILALDLHLIEAQGIRVSVQGGDVIPVETRAIADPLDTAVPLFSGTISIPTIGTYDRLGQIRIERYQPTPATLIAIVPAIEVGEI